MTSSEIQLKKTFNLPFSQEYSQQTICQENNNLILHQDVLTLKITIYKTYSSQGPLKSSIYISTSSSYSLRNLANSLFKKFVELNY